MCQCNRCWGKTHFVTAGPTLDTNTAVPLLNSTEATLIQMPFWTPYNEPVVLCYHFAMTYVMGWLVRSRKSKNRNS